MNLIKTFPEVELFFKNDKFTQEELLVFIREIENRYTNNQLRKSVSTLISLKILQYEIFPKKTPTKSNIVNKAEKLNLLPKGNNKFHPLLNRLKSNSIESMAINLDWSLSRTLRLLEQKGILKNGESILDKKEFALVRDMFNARLWGLQRIEKNKNPGKRVIQTHKEKSINNQNDVYSKIQAIGLGKVIYIRKK